MMIGEALRLIRVFHDLKQTDAANKLQISQSFLSEIERGTKTPTLDLLQRYADTFDLPASSIVYFAENINHPSTSTRFVATKIISLLQFLEQKSSRIVDG